MLFGGSKTLIQLTLTPLVISDGDGAGGDEARDKNGDGDQGEVKVLGGRVVL